MSVAEELKNIRETVTTSRRSRIQARESAPEVLDPTPVEVPTAFQGSPSLKELVEQYVQGAMSQQAAQQGLGTFEEEDDFEEENPDLLDLSGYEVFDQEFVEEIQPGEVAPAQPVLPAETPQAGREAVPEPPEAPASEVTK